MSQEDFPSTPTAPVDSRPPGRNGDDPAKLTRFVINLGAKPEEACDVAQEAMQAAMRSWPHTGSPHAFTRTAAKRIYLREAQKNRRVREALLKDTDPHTVNVSEWGLRETDSQSVLELLNLLPSEQRTVMAWTMDGYSPGEIAEMTGHNPATVRSHLRHARRRLIRELNARKETSDGT